jgi:oligopeptidase B
MTMEIHSRRRVMAKLSLTRRIVRVAWLPIAALCVAVAWSGCAAQVPQPPVAKIVPVADTLFGDVRVDNYFWLRDRDNPEVIAYLDAENAYTDTMMSHTAALQQKLYEEMLGRIKETDLDVPEKADNYFYYTRTEEGKQYKFYCRKNGSLDAPEEILLDHNALAAGKDFCDLGVYLVSPSHTLLAYSIDTTGGERYTLYVKDLTTGAMLPDEVPNTSDAVWANDNQTIFYSTMDEAHRPYQLHRHSLGTDASEDVLVYQEDDDQFYLDIERTKSKAFLLLALGSITSSEFWYLDANTPMSEFKVIQPREPDHEYDVTHHGDRFYITTNDQAKNFKLVSVSTANPARQNWKEEMAHDPKVKIDGAEAFANHLVIYKRENGLQGLEVTDFQTGESHDIAFPEPVYSFNEAANPDYNTNLLRFTYYSMVTPRTVYDYNMGDRTREMKKQYEVLGGYDPSQYQQERIFATASDGTQIPISMVYRKGMVRDGTNPLNLYGYGSYGISEDPWFSSNRLSLLDRGFIFAIAHIRGGGEMGRYWYDDGKLLKKKNTFTDFIACAEHLIAEKYTSKEKLVIEGGSAGGLLMGAVVNMRPDLFKAVNAGVPFVDVINTMLDESIPLTTIEFDEWGNPKIEEDYHYMRSYSPYDNAEAKAYPDMLITAGLNDPRVQYWEPAKWTAKLRAMKTDHNLLLLKTEMGSGHMGASGRYDFLKDIAFEYAFVLDRLGINK